MKKKPFKPMIKIEVKMPSHEMGTVLVDKMVEVLIARMTEEERSRIVGAVHAAVQERTDAMVDDIVDKVNEYLKEGGIET